MTVSLNGIGGKPGNEFVALAYKPGGNKENQALSLFSGPTVQ